MSTGPLAYRDRVRLPRLGTVAPTGPILLDTNVFINALAGRGPAELKSLLVNLPHSFVSGPTVAELSWPSGRLDPAHRDTARVLATLQATLAQLDPVKILVPTASQWADAGALAGRAARGVAGQAKSIRTAFDRVELINDAVTAAVALGAGMTIVTEDGDFDLFLQLVPTLAVLFYE